jgi:hypothetical protein
MKRYLVAAMTLVFVSGAVTALVVQRARAGGIPTTTPLIYSGVLEQNGSAVTGSHDFDVRLWTCASCIGSDAIACTTTKAGTAVTSGSFQVALGDGCVEAVRQNPDLWVEVVVDGTSLGRTKLGAVPYAVEARRTTYRDPGNGKSYSVGGSYCGATAAHDGNLGGYAGAKAMCETACASPSAHICDRDELLRRLSLGIRDMPRGWYQGQYGQSDECLGFTYSTDASYDGSLYCGYDNACTNGCRGLNCTGACNTSNAVLCCD